jgi:hypothetical protein
VTFSTRIEIETAHHSVLAMNGVALPAIILIAQMYKQCMYNSKQKLLNLVSKNEFVLTLFLKESNS